MQCKRDWNAYDKKLMQRGAVYLDPKVLHNWDKELQRMNKNKEGHQFEYPVSFIQFIGLLKVNFGFTYRKIIGFIDSFSALCPALKKIPNYTTLFRRMNNMKLNLAESISKSSEPLFLSIDASGLKADHGGTWLEKRFGRKKRKWIKIHFAIDTNSKRIIELSVTTDNVHDNRRFRGIVKRASKNHKISKIAADPAYDDYKNYELLHKKKIRSAIKPRLNSNPDYLQARYNPKMFPRWLQILLFHKYSFKTWKNKTGYNYRTLSESCFSAFKANYGEGVSAKKFHYARNEILWKAYAYNISR